MNESLTINSTKLHNAASLEEEEAMLVLLFIVQLLQLHSTT